MDGRLRRLVEASEAIVFFGGAGVSCESGIPDFRSTDGLYHQEYRWPPEEILSHDFFERRPEEFFRFYRDKMLYPQAEPNAAHLALARLEQAGKLKAVVTQNIDGLHQAAGAAARFIRWMTCCAPKACRGAAAAASSSRTWCCTEKRWMKRRSTRLCAPSAVRTCCW